LLTVQQDPTPTKAFFRMHLVPSHVSLIKALNDSFSQRVVAPGLSSYLPKKPSANTISFLNPEPGLFKAHVSLCETFARGTSADYVSARGPNAPYPASTERSCVAYLSRG
jgi:hypothetical protein